MTCVERKWISSNLSPPSRKSSPRLIRRSGMFYSRWNRHGLLCPSVCAPIAFWRLLKSTPTIMLINKDSRFIEFYRIQSLPNFSYKHVGTSLLPTSSLTPSITFTGDVHTCRKPYCLLDLLMFRSMAGKPILNGRDSVRKVLDTFRKVTIESIDLSRITSWIIKVYKVSYLRGNIFKKQSGISKFLQHHQYLKCNMYPKLPVLVYLHLELWNLRNKLASNIWKTLPSVPNPIESSC